MDKRLKILDLLKMAFSSNNARFGRYVSYIASVADIDYLSDDEFLERLEAHADFSFDKEWNWDNLDTFYDIEFEEGDSYRVTFEREQLAYKRYLSKLGDRVFFQLTEVLLYKDFLK